MSESPQHKHVECGGTYRKIASVFQRMVMELKRGGMKRKKLQVKGKTWERMIRRPHISSPVTF